ncbi:DsbA family protein [Colwellia echini]|uniref:DsbA family protein n=1 Tax=Colwellia echini TaxID=1982103 RepID=A0ABY3MWG5_9GAMM|nr:DsbA family protein [Colwellia echini]TYK65555.1 DsbA family protein [Colwellia echini]
MDITLYYIHDPMCSWCWGYSPTWHMLKEKLPSKITVEYVAGGLAPDSDEPMPIAQQQAIEGYWRTIETKLGTQFNYDFWRKNIPRRSTYNACRAVIAANKQGAQQEMIDAIQQGYYLDALNPSDVDMLIGVAQRLTVQTSAKFNTAQFIQDLSAKETEVELQRQLNLARSLTQQGFPSLVLEVNGRYHQISIDYLNYKTSLAEILTKLVP